MQLQASLVGKAWPSLGFPGFWGAWWFPRERVAKASPAPHAPCPWEGTCVPSLLLLHRQVSPAIKCTDANKPALNSLLLLLLWENINTYNHSLAHRDPFRCAFQAGWSLVCAVAFTLCRGTMTGLQAARQDGYDNYTGIFFSLLGTAGHSLLLCLCNTSMGCGADPHAQLMQGPCVIFCATRCP